MYLEQQIGAQIARGTVGIRLPSSRFVCKIKMSQDKDPVSQQQVIAALRRDGPYRNDAVAADMRRALDEFIVGGIRTNIELHRRLLQNEEVLAGTMTTRTIEPMLADAKAAKANTGS